MNKNLFNHFIDEEDNDVFLLHGVEYTLYMSGAGWCVKASEPFREDRAHFLGTREAALEFILKEATGAWNKN